MIAFRRRLGGVTLAGLMAAVAMVGNGCIRRDPWTRPASTDSRAAYEVWLSRLAETVSARDWHRIGEALQEIRIEIMAERERRRTRGAEAGSGAGTIDDALRERIRGRPLREIVQLGFELRRARLTGELVLLERAMDQNDRLVTRPGDLESRQHLDGLRERQMARVATYRLEIDATEHELTPLMKATGKELVPRAMGRPEVMPVPIHTPPPR